MPPIVPTSSRSSNFSFDVLTLVTGTTIAQVITILAYPIITRLYGPDAFGLLALFTSITNLIGVIACMRYELAIMLPKSDEEAANVFGLSVFFVFIISFLTIPFIIIFQQPLLQFLKAPQFGPYLWLIPSTILLGGLFLAFNYWNTRTKQFYRLSIATVTRSCSTVGTQFTLGFTGYAAGGSLIYANIFGQIIATIVLGFQILKEYYSFFRKCISRKGMMDALKRYVKFPKYDVFSALVNTLSWQIPIFLLAFFFSTTIVGYYSLGMMVIQLPMSFIGGAIGQVFYQRATEAYHNNQLPSVVGEVFDILLIMSIFPMLLLAICGKELFLTIFGTAWGEAGIYVQILSFWAIFWFISSPLSTLIAVREKLQFGLFLTLLNFGTRLLSIVIGGLLGSVFLALSLFSLSGVLVYGLACFIFLNLAEISSITTLKMITKRSLYSIPFLVPIIFMEFFSVSAMIITLTAFGICIGYCLFIFYTVPRCRDLIENLAKKLLKKK